MLKLPTLRRKHSRPDHESVTGGSAGPISRFAGLAILAIVAAVLITNVTLTPSKRNIEAFAGVAFLGIVLVAHPRKALYFTIVILHYPAYTTVGSTSTLLILALAALLLVKSIELDLPTPFWNRGLDGPLVAFTMVVVISLYQVPDEHMRTAVLKVMSMVSAVTLYYVVQSLIQTPDQLKTLIRTFMWAAASLYVIGFLQSIFPDRKILPEFFSFSKKIAEMEEIRRGEIRVMATFPGFELFTEYLVLTLFLQYYQFRQIKNLNAKILQIAILLLGVAVLFATATRGGVVMLVVGWLTLLLLSSDVVPKKDLLRVLFLAMAMFYLTLPFFGSYYAFMIERLGMMVAGEDVSNVSGRTDVWGQAIDGIIAKPIQGHGFYEALNMFQGYVTMHIHSMYIAIGYKLGLPGLIFFLSFVLGLLYRGFRVLRDKTVDKSVREVLLFGIALLIMFLIDEAKISFTRDALPMHTTFAIFAIVGAALRIARTHGSAQDSDIEFQ